MKLVVITGGPGAGKTAVLEMAKKLLNEKVAILPEAASIIYGGGFWRLPSISARTAAQKAIYHVQNEMEVLVREERKWTLGLCDRGSLDGVAYWPNEQKTFWEMCNTSLEKELKKYYAVIHLHSPTDEVGYNHQNPLRTETALQAGIIDKKIHEVWKGHPRYTAVATNKDFLLKANIVLDQIKALQVEIEKLAVP